MGGQACIVFDQTLTEYNVGPSHPLAPVRLDLTMRLARALDVVGGAGIKEVPAPVASDEEIALVHDPAYIDAVKSITSSADRNFAYGLGTEDNPTFAGMHHASAHVVGASIEAARRVRSGDVLHAVNIAGGLHHAMRSNAS